MDGRSQGTDGGGELLPSNASLGGGLYDPSEACDSEEDGQAPKRQKAGDTQAQHDAAAVGCAANGGGRGSGQGGEGGGRVGTVLVWDLDETLICFNSLLTASFPMGSQGDAEDAALLHFAEELETLLYALIEVAPPPWSQPRRNLPQMPPDSAGICMGVDSRNHGFAPGLPPGWSSTTSSSVPCTGVPRS